MGSTQRLRYFAPSAGFVTKPASFPADGEAPDILDSISEAFFSLSLCGRFTKLNRAAELWFGLTAPMLLGRLYTEILSAEQARDFESAMVTALKTGRSTVRQRRSVAKAQLWVECRCEPWADGVYVFLRDISERKLQQTEAARSLALLQATVDALSSQVAILDLTGRIISVNESWIKFGSAYGSADPQRGVNRNYLSLCKGAAATSPDAKRAYDGLCKVLQGALPEFRAEYSCTLGKDELFFQLHIRRYCADGLTYAIVAHEDVTATRQSEHALRRLADQLLTAQDEVRRQMARELHDTTAQHLLCAALMVGRAASSKSNLTAEARACLAEALDLISVSQDEIRTLSYLLHPPMLDEAGLPSAMRWFANGFTRRTNLEIEVQVHDFFESTRLPPHMEMALFRIVQEAVTNVHRHSGSPITRISLEMSGPSGVRLEIADEGCGFAACAGSGAPHGVGLLGMAERMGQLGGDIRFKANDRGGASVVATIPLARDAA